MPDRNSKPAGVVVVLDGDITWTENAGGTASLA